ncbi:thiamine pyrophosphate-binding protein [Roseicyclus sp. F158]|uniref:Thiamine pyrophosphate-binding protein n=1 Tax=Tropicimonas omnivorans TaxID=3075590 RepID=A0ABU3DCJ6_9RHOB|nr:thiamine pyrophosphate-binding protein [Roseicyclus sp. F158]MDT0681445.1 thiamine pyrophosphate-binding protein [Roseicyclus sp. F158]
MSKVYEILAEVFRREDTPVCFSLLGDANMNWAGALAARGTRMIYTRHEHAAVAAATAHARRTGRTGVATVTCGPGLSQIVTALPAAVRASIPLVIFAGESPIGAAWYNQELDQGPVVTSTGAAYVPLHSISRMPEAIRNAFVQAHEERRPVVLGVPLDLQSREWPGGDLPTPSADIIARPSPMPPNPDDVTAAARRIASAKRIVVMGGLGAASSGASDACRALASKLGALLTTTLPARGLFQGDPFCVGISGGFSSTLARALFAEADLVISFGAQLTSHNLDKGKLYPNAEFLRVDTRPQSVTQGLVLPGTHLRGDARLTAEALVEAVEEAGGWRSDRLAAAIGSAVCDTATFPQDSYLDPRDVTSALDAALPQDWQMVNSSGHCSFYTAHMHRPFETFLTIREYGAIGNGLPYAMGAAASDPERPVVLFDGDGSIMMNVQELETIRREGLKVLICCYNDRAYGSEIHKLRDEGLPDDGAVFGETDLAAIARGFGLGGHRVDDLSELPDLIETFRASGGAMLLDFHVSDRIASPVVRRAHPGGHCGTEHPVSLEGLL